MFGDVNMSMRIAKEEVFGPVMSVLKFSTDAEAIAMANGIDLGLTAAIWTNDINRALKVAQAVQAGYIWINGVGQHYRGVPYGGFKNSGIGREEGISELLELHRREGDQHRARQRRLQSGGRLERAVRCQSVRIRLVSV